MAVTAKLWIYVSTVPTPVTLTLHVGSAGDNWGASLNATEADFISTGPLDGETKVISTTGWHSFTFDPTYLAIGGTTYFRFNSSEEGAASSKVLTAYTEDNASLQPYIEYVDDNAGKLFPFWKFKR